MVRPSFYASLAFLSLYISSSYLCLLNSVFIFSLLSPHFLLPAAELSCGFVYLFCLAFLLSAVCCELLNHAYALSLFLLS